MFWTGIFEMQKEYIMVEHAVDRSLSGEQTFCRYVRCGVSLAGQSAGCVCVGWS